MDYRTIMNEYRVSDITAELVVEYLKEINCTDDYWDWDVLLVVGAKEAYDKSFVNPLDLEGAQDWYAGCPSSYKKEYGNRYMVALVDYYSNKNSFLIREG